MGGCLNTKNNKLPVDMPAEYLNDTQTPHGYLIPLETTLFNLLRKPNELQLIRYSSPNPPIFNRQTAPNLRSLSAKDMKMLYSFKNIVVVGDRVDDVNLIRGSANPKQIYCISDNFASSFLQKFPIFKAGQSILQPKYVPIYVFNSEQIIKKGSKKQIFIHSQANQNQNIYPYLRINQIIQDKTTYTSEQMSKSIQKCSANTILFLHSRQRKPDDLLAILSQAVSNQYGISLLNAQIYTRKSLPQTSLNIDDRSLQAQNQQPQKITSIPKQQLTLTQTYQKYLQQLYIQMGSNDNAKNKVDRAYNLLVTLLSNIYNNKTSQHYRTVRKTNPQVNDLLGKYKYGVRLLSEVGFLDKGSGYVNSTDVKYLKIYRTDLDMAYRNFLTQA